MLQCCCNASTHSWKLILIKLMKWLSNGSVNKLTTFGKNGKLYGADSFGLHITKPQSSPWHLRGQFQPNMFLLYTKYTKSTNFSDCHAVYLIYMDYGTPVTLFRLEFKRSVCVVAWTETHPLHICIFIEKDALNNFAHTKQMKKRHKRTI